MNSADSNTKKPVSSRIDPSGTDPNRYANVAKPLKNNDSSSFFPTANISKLERIAMIAAGSYLLYKAFKADNKATKAAEVLAGGTMLARGITGYCPLYNSMDSGKLSGKKVEFNSSVTVDQSPEEAYENWRKLENLPTFLKHISKVNEINKTDSEWTVEGPGGIGKITWQSQILVDEPGKVLSWKSLEGSSVNNSGKITFTEVAPGQTRVDVKIGYKAPFGIAGEKVAQWLQSFGERKLNEEVQGFQKAGRIEAASAN